MYSVQRPLPPYITIMAGYEQEPKENGGVHICLWRDKKALTVQAPGIPEGDKIYSEPFEPLAEICKKMNDHNEFLVAKLETLLASITFGHSNWAFLVTGKNGSYTLQYRNKAMRKVTCSPWAPLVYEEDIIYTKWRMPELREGIWNSQEVDIYMSWNDMSRGFLDLTMKGHILLSGLDLAYEVVGHVINSDGEIIGLMTSPANGRAIQFCDRNIVYAAISKLQQNGLTFHSIASETILISQGKVRLLSISGVRSLKHETEERRLMEYHCLWNELDDIFDQLKYSPNGFTPTRLVPTEPHIFTIIPPPQKPLNDEVSLMSMYFTRFTLDFYFQVGKDKHTPVKRNRRSLNRGVAVLLAPEATTESPLNITPSLTSVRERYSAAGTKYSRTGRRSVRSHESNVLEGIASITEIED